MLSCPLGLMFPLNVSGVKKSKQSVLSTRIVALTAPAGVLWIVPPIGIVFNVAESTAVRPKLPFIAGGGGGGGVIMLEPPPQPSKISVHAQEKRDRVRFIFHP